MKANDGNFIKQYYLKKGSCRGISPILLSSLGLASIFTLFILYTPNPLRLSSKQDLSLSSPKQHSPSLSSSSSSSSIKPPIEYENCDLFKGKWVPSLNGSLYTTSSCVTIPDSKNCFKHGRKDRDFIDWRWKPEGCKLHRFDPHEFLKIVGGKKLAFVGDSVARNHVESLLCLLSQAETPTDVYKDEEDRFRTWHFPSSNFTLMILWSQFLIHSEEIMVNNSGSGSFNLHLDRVDEKWASILPDLDYAIISGAHWFFRKNYLYTQGKLMGCVYCSEPNVTNFDLQHALRMSLRGALKHINSCKECNNKGMVTLVRTFSPAHFENGAWDTGGGCNRTSPYSEDETNDKKLELELGQLQVEEVERARKEGKKGVFLGVLDVTKAMLMRPDGHPGEFWGNKWMKGYNDCVHWCLPGPIDTWSDLLLAVVQKEAGLSQRVRIIRK